MPNILRSYWDGFMAIIYPRLCLACDEPLVRGEDFVCSTCLYKIKRTDHHLHLDNPIARLFYGRIELAFATSHFAFDKGGSFQQLVHSLKYKGQKEIGDMLGRDLGNSLKRSPHLPQVDVVIPVPLHRKRQRVRGYNQSEYIAQGISSVLGVGVDIHTLKRHKYDGSQTRLSNEERWENVANNFKVNNTKRLQHKHILLVDDVLTTGATIESCYQALQSIEGVRVSVATLARAE